MATTSLAHISGSNAAMLNPLARLAAGPRQHLFVVFSFTEFMTTFYSTTDQGAFRTLVGPSLKLLLVFSSIGFPGFTFREVHDQDFFFPRHVLVSKWRFLFDDGGARLCI
jgi:hypothetical protein